MVNNASELVNEKDSDIKLDNDPTQHSDIIDADGCNIDCNMTYSQAFVETQKFINDNNSADRPYLRYPKLFLQCNNVRCDDKLHCKECYKCRTKENKNTYTNTSTTNVVPTESPSANINLEIINNVNNNFNDVNKHGINMDGVNYNYDYKYGSRRYRQC